MTVRHIGFTGTRQGMSEFQKQTFETVLTAAVLQGDPVYLHHGDCKGADAEAHDIALRVGCHVIIHPPVKRIMRAYCQGADMILEPEEYLERDRCIVDATIGLIAAPKSNEEEKRSGTWYTVRYARKMNKRVILLPRETV
jgi:predicted Rossmann fold nucleotide-binding protein DprA/Smf involved in DNA uptake